MGFMLAHAGHDAQIRALLRTIDMPGPIRLAFCREPDYFLGQGIYGPVSQTLVWESKGEIKAMGCRSVKTVYINGRETGIGYLHGLRIAPSVRNHTVLGRGYRAIRELHADGLAPAYLTTIVNANRAARRVLTSKKAGIPEYRDIGTYHVSTLFLDRHVAGRKNGIEIVNGARVSLDDIIRFLNKQGRRRQFFPFMQESDFNSPYTRGFSPKDFLVAVNGSNIIGTLGLWDQRAYKQHIIAGYSGSFSMVRPFINVMLKAAGCLPLPPPGKHLGCLIACFVCVDGDDPCVLESLLAEAMRNIHGNGFFGVSIGFHESDPLRNGVKRYFRLSYESRMYLACWEDGRSFCDACGNGRIPYLELGAL